MFRLPESYPQGVSVLSRQVVDLEITASSELTALAREVGQQTSRYSTMILQYILYQQVKLYNNTTRTDSLTVHLAFLISIFNIWCTIVTAKNKSENVMNYMAYTMG